MNRYRVNEIFYSLQGEGVRAGTANTFVRFSGCNMRCSRDEADKSPGGFDCDTEFESGVWVDGEMGLLQKVQELSQGCKNVIYTGGEPGLQVTETLIRVFKDAGFYQAIETNGSIPLPAGLDWICVSPKVAEHAIRQLTANEVKYVRHYGQGIPKTVVTADHYLVSPAFDNGTVSLEDIAWCIELVKENPTWRMSCQQHKWWRVR